MAKIMFFCKWCQTNKYGTVISDTTPREKVRIMQYRCGACNRVTSEVIDMNDPKPHNPARVPVTAPEMAVPSITDGDE